MLTACLLFENSTTGNNNYTCPICKKVFSSYSNLNFYLKNIRMKSPIAINVKSLWTKSCFLRHKVTYNRGEQTTLECEEYFRVFIQKYNISHNPMDNSMSPEEDIPIKTTTNGDVEKKIIVCSTCDKDFHAILI